MRKKTTSDINRILGKLDKSGGCWRWTGCLQRNGYARTAVGSRTDGSRHYVLVHRFVYQSLVGGIPDGLVIDHLCRNRACSNPDHLEPVTPGENIRRGVFPPKPSHCPHGHPYSEHAYYRPDRNHRECRVCNKANMRRQYQKRKAARAV